MNREDGATSPLVSGRRRDFLLENRPRPPAARRQGKHETQRRGANSVRLHRSVSGVACPLVQDEAGKDLAGCYDHRALSLLPPEPADSAL
jgi:hypothetical protein